MRMENFYSMNTRHLNKYGKVIIDVKLLAPELNTLIKMDED